jgi:hypothetical protein
MAVQTLVLGKASGKWEDGEHIVGKLVGLSVEWIPVKREDVKRGDKSRKGTGGPEKECHYITFDTATGPVRKNATKAWIDIVGAKGVKTGDVLDVTAQPEVRAGKNRFRPFKVNRLTGSDIPKGLR